ncbi:hypothetical protein ACNFH5_05120 [Pseudomonas sp. NY15435]|uniref:hypothetical protein n=1 Tax=Pseudomonas sp. NY15435 TaxID=3400358 RepID=UPI003A88930C
MLEWFAAAVSSTQTATDIARALVELRDGELIRSKVFDLNQSLMSLQQQLMTAQVQQMEMQQRISDLEAALRKAQERNDDRSKYQLVRLPAGGMAYECMEPGSHHFVCSNCFDQGEKSVLHLHYLAIGSNYSCPRCKTVARHYRHEG